jgi:hypothetical protein
MCGFTASIVPGVKFQLTITGRFRFNRIRECQPVMVRDIADLKIVAIGRGGVTTLVGGHMNDPWDLFSRMKNGDQDYIHCNSGEESRSRDRLASKESCTT